MAAQIGKPVGAVKTHLRLGLGRISERLMAGPGLGMDGLERNGGTK
jgi:DNA-directed RNA polymerase specialized sigma24 family protein